MKGGWIGDVPQALPKPQSRGAASRLRFGQNVRPRGFVAVSDPRCFHLRESAVRDAVRGHPQVGQFVDRDRLAVEEALDFVMQLLQVRTRIIHTFLVLSDTERRDLYSYMRIV